MFYLAPLMVNVRRLHDYSSEKEGRKAQKRQGMKLHAFQVSACMPDWEALFRKFKTNFYLTKQPPKSQSNNASERRYDKCDQVANQGRLGIDQRHLHWQA